MEITIRTPVNPTEDKNKVLDALSYFWMTKNFEEVGEGNRIIISLITTNRESLVSLRQAIHDYRIIDAVKKLLRNNWTGTMTMLVLDKQAASSGKLKVVDDTEYAPPLGGIEVIIRLATNHEFESFLDWFVPHTVKGEIVDS
ncbi:hypothetical protein EU537_01175 [Candidatus Thorarchaeota archaeon]|nr:MAG: hypothetical protein EU537_01175 [Candidatus Thorarchaeota archaeon]